MWRPLNILTMVLGAAIGGAVASGCYVYVGALIEGALLTSGPGSSLAVFYGVIASAAGAVIGFAAGIGAALVVVPLRRSERSRSRIWWATLASVVAGSSVLAWMFAQMSSIEHNLALIGASAVLIAVLASIGLTLCERRQRARITRARAPRRTAQAGPRPAR